MSSQPQSSRDATSKNRYTPPAPGNKSHNWWRRNVKKDLEQIAYHDSVEAALKAAGLK